MTTRSWDSIPVTPIDDPARATINRVLLERLVDELGDLDVLVHSDQELDRQKLRDRVGEAMTIACAALDLVAPVPAN